MGETLKFPFYARITLILLGLISVFYIFYISQDILVPVVFAFLFAILLRPVMLFFKRTLHFPHVLAVIFTVLSFVIVVVGIVIFLSVQISDFTEDWGMIQKNFAIHVSHLQDYVRQHFDISKREQQQYINDATKDTMKTGKQILGSTLLSFTDTLVNLILVPIYLFLMLLYRTHFMKFLCKLIKPEHHGKLEEIIFEVKNAVKGYINGLIIEMIIVSVLTTVGFMIIGVKYAVLLGLLTGLLNLIPYIGILVAGLLSIVASLSGSPELSIIIGVVVVNLVVQFIDNNILVPMIVSSKVQINAFISILGIIIGGAIAGIPGMFLAIPLIAIMKVICDRIDFLEPWGYLVGDDLPKTYQWKKMKFPLYNYENNATGHVDAEIKKPLFTGTTTAVAPTLPSDDNNKTNPGTEIS
ncbi:MAG: AI-2E family transporter [Flavobacterium sp. BFFFF1]|uniref:AI-2E family transporter n=1 Tax=unclassified Flavobacterium TaxID=196869 RepID=UPI000BC7FB74|nr:MULTISPECIES: AI-2E family transporter [unclassified Flavobacterium]OYU81295.1 MAG: AI-2E family transporter [Flavobacterium sp. BFFFF1]